MCIRDSPYSYTEWNTITTTPFDDILRIFDPITGCFYEYNYRTEKLKECECFVSNRKGLESFKSIETFENIDAEYAFPSFVIETNSLDVYKRQNSGLAAGETIEQWIWFDKMALVAAGISLLIPFVLRQKKYLYDSAYCLSVALMIWGGAEAVWGICQLYGLDVYKRQEYLTISKEFLLTYTMYLMMHHLL